MSFASRLFDGLKRLQKRNRRPSIDLHYFEGIWPTELEAITKRRRDNGRDPVVRRRPPDGDHSVTLKVPEAPSRRQSPDPEIVFPSGAFPGRRGASTGIDADPQRPDESKMRPQPVPCDATGLAFSGGGIRSAAVCLGALQALFKNNRLKSIDYLSTVSGGGYIGSCLSAAMSKGSKKFPFGADIFDSDAVAHLRNYSNYLMPRDRSSLRNGVEAAAVVLRGLLANFVIVFTLLLAAALLTWIVYPDPTKLHAGSFVFRLPRVFLPRLIPNTAGLFATPFLAPLMSAGLLAAILILWAIIRSFSLDAFVSRLAEWLSRRNALLMRFAKPMLAFVNSNIVSSDTRGLMLYCARILILMTGALAFLDLQPILINVVLNFEETARHGNMSVTHWLSGTTTTLAAFAGVVSGFASSLGHFLKTSERATSRSTTFLRIAAQGAVLLAACILPLLIWLAYLVLAASLIGTAPLAIPSALTAHLNAHLLQPLTLTWPSLSKLFLYLCTFGAIVSLCFGANGYTLHRFYRDRLSKAFLFEPCPGDVEPQSLDTVKLSELRASDGPYHIINAALNVQASVEANKRGRNADFFIFTPDFVGSDLTMYSSTATPSFVSTKGMEAVDPELDLATAMAISGAAVSANMGSNTIRALSPTLALLNIRLGYWLRNPRFIAARSQTNLALRKLTSRFRDKLYLLAEILNLHDETSPVLFLTDGGHIENLGLYELLKRGCETIIMVDAEADPQLAFPSLLKVERYARIDLGVRIMLPWEDIAAGNWVSDSARLPNGARAPHCAVGRIYYADGTQGMLLYFKSSLTGDEKDYILDYQRRNPTFPHETTGDQFFTEEQFEMYRALGFHMVDGFFNRDQAFSYLRRGDGAFADADAAFYAIAASVSARP